MFRNGNYRGSVVDENDNDSIEDVTSTGWWLREIVNKFPASVLKLNKTTAKLHYDQLMSNAYETEEHQIPRRIPRCPDNERQRWSPVSLRPTPEIAFKEDEDYNRPIVDRFNERISIIDEGDLCHRKKAVAQRNDLPSHRVINSCR